MNLKDLLTGITTLQPYYDEPAGYHLSAEHDQIWLHSTSRPLSPEDVQKMIDASWWQEHEDYGEDFTVADYDPDESWTGYT